MTRRWLCALAAVGLSACTSPTQMAMTIFQQDYFCPSERTTTVVRKDLAVHEFACAARDREWVDWGDCLDGEVCSKKEQLERCRVSPPAKIAADPERLAVWNAREATLWAAYDSGFTPVVEVSGCGKRVWYAWAWRYTWRQRRRYPKLIVLKVEGDRREQIGGSPRPE